MDSCGKLDGYIDLSFPSSFPLGRLLKRIHGSYLSCNLINSHRWVNTFVFHAVMLLVMLSLEINVESVKSFLPFHNGELPAFSRIFKSGGFEYSLPLFVKPAILLKPKTVLAEMIPLVRSACRNPQEERLRASAAIFDAHPNIDEPNTKLFQELSNDQLVLPPPRIHTQKHEVHLPATPRPFVASTLRSVAAPNNASMHLPNIASLKIGDFLRPGFQFF